MPIHLPFTGTGLVLVEPRLQQPGRLLGGAVVVQQVGETVNGVERLGTDRQRPLEEFPATRALPRLARGEPQPREERPVVAQRLLDRLEQGQHRFQLGRPTIEEHVAGELGDHQQVGGRAPDVGLGLLLGRAGRVDQADQDGDVFALPVGRVGRRALRPFPVAMRLGLADILRHVVACGRGEGEITVQL